MTFCNSPHKIWPQVVGAICASLGTLTCGTVRAWASPGVPSLLSSGKVPGLDPQVDEAWIGSLPQLGSIIGALIIPWPLQRFGRRWSMVFMSFPWILGFLLTGFAQNRAMLYVGRILGGLIEGMVIPAAQVFITEISSPDIRGFLGSFTVLFQMIGTLLTYVIGSYVSWDLLAFLLIIFPAMFGISMLCLPESPLWLLTKQRDADARKALQFYRGSDADIDEEYNRVRDNVEQTITLQKRVSLRELFEGTILKPLLIILVLTLSQQTSAFNAVVVYTVKIFEMAGGVVDKYSSTMIIGAVLVVSIGIGAYVVDTFGRRVLFFVSDLFVVAALVVLGVFFYLKELWGDNEAENALGWLPLVCVIVYMSSFALGICTVPTVLMAELFPMRFRHTLTPISYSVSSMASFVIVRTFPDAIANLGVYGTFWHYAGWSFAALVFAYFFLPETKGKTLDEISDMFKAKSPEGNVRLKENGLDGNQTNLNAKTKIVTECF